LHLAARHGHYKIAVLLLDKGADVNAQSKDYSNALQAALERGQKQVVRLLVNKGADINA
ncbi:ankyrin, partial [Cenococcum geophilum 1.58]